MYKKFWITMMMFGFSFVGISSYGYFTVTTKVTILNLDKGFQPITIHNDGGGYTNYTEAGEYNISVGNVSQPGAYQTATVNYGETYICIYQSENREGFDGPPSAASMQEFDISYTPLNSSKQKTFSLIVATYDAASNFHINNKIGYINYGFDYNNGSGPTAIFSTSSSRQFSYTGGIFNEGGSDGGPYLTDAAYSNFLVFTGSN